LTRGISPGVWFVVAFVNFSSLSAIISLTYATVNTRLFPLFTFVIVNKSNGGDLVFFYKFVDLCNAVGKSPSSVAEEMGYQRSVVTRWSKGTSPRQATLQRIADYFGVPVSDLTADGQKEKPATVSGDELDPVTREIMDILSDLTPEELALAKSRLLKIKESR
jgi:transcriptional regulator with XRE-family HTH domain